MEVRKNKKSTAGTVDLNRKERTTKMQESAIYHEREELAPEIVDGLSSEFGNLHEVLVRIERLTRKTNDRGIQLGSTKMVIGALAPLSRIRSKLHIPF